MAYTCSLDGNILTIRSVTINDRRQDTVNYWYTNIVEWTKSTTGVKDDRTCMLPMDESGIAWCKDHHLPKVGIPLADGEPTWREVFYGTA